ncbi:prolyl oligopeptidase family protein [Chitinophaga sp. S165]|nr:prolyl oligopeptidase family protein [Chitinophaga sp. S165]
MGTLSAQKKVLDFNAINSWPSVTGYGISNDGKYLWYTLDSGRIGSTLFIADVSGQRKLTYSRCYGPKFSNDSRHILFMSGSGVYKIRLYDFKELFIKNAKDIIISEHSSWASYYQDGEMKLANIDNGSQFTFTNVVQRWFDPSGRHLLIKYRDSLSLFNLVNLQSRKLVSRPNVGSICFNNSGSKLLFSVEGANTSIYMYSETTDKTELIMSDSLVELGKRIALSGQGLGFNKTSDIVYFKYKILQDAPQKDSNLITNFVDVWHYRDRFLQSQQLLQKSHQSGIFNPEQLYQGVKPINGKSEAFLLENADTIIHLSIGNKYGLVKSVNNIDEVYWNEEEWPSYQLVSLTDGSRIDFLKASRCVFQVALSPSEKFITWIDTTLGKYICYNIETKQTIPLETNDNSDRKLFPGGMIFDSWTEGDASIICHDDYDLWNIDPLGHKSPICITGGYGKSKKIKFSIIENQDQFKKTGKGDEIIVAAIDDSTMDNGFYKITLSSFSTPKRLLWGPHLYYFPGLFIGGPRPPLKALNADVYLMIRQSDTESPNLMVTKDFIGQHFITDIHPEGTFKWYNTKLVSWTTSCDESAKGILYIPDDLDTTRKYPIIFNYYEKRSTEYRRYHKPELSVTNINIPYYINKGYLVFVPDIPQKEGHTFENALNVIESGASYLAHQFGWIDKSKMGLQGQSFGGTVTNFVATHSKMFAAAQSSAGRTDFISCYGGLGFGGKSLQGVVEVFQNKLGYTPWDRPDVYINNSSIFGVGDCVTPLLIAHGTDDAVVNVSQAIELFTALRRAGKKVWFLQYNSNHVMESRSEVGKDFMKRQAQFFDYYLQGMPAPVWMTQGIPTKYKGIKSGLTLDGPNRVP